MEQEPQRELEWYTLRRVAYWVRVSGKLLFISIAIVLVIMSLILLASH